MIRKIISIKNVGRFRNSAAPGNPELSRHTLIVGANGYGKTTICAVLRSLKSGDPAHITGRRTLGIEDPPNVELLLPGGPTRFDGAAWSASYSAIDIFDGVFVAENVHSGEVVEIDHRRNLYRVIIGEEGVRLAEEDTRLAAQSREKTSDISGVERAIRPHIPASLNLNQYVALPADPDIDAKIAEQERSVEAVRQAQQIIERPPLSEIAIPSLPEDFAGLLAKTIDDVAQDAESRLAEHLATHGMEADGGNWIVKGLDHADRGTCLFCGRDIRDLPLISAYRAVFSNLYKALRDETAAMRSEIDAQFGDGALERLRAENEQCKGGVEFWSRYCTFDSAPLAFSEDSPEAIRALGQAALALLERKHRAPLEPIPLDETFATAATAYEAVQATTQATAEAIHTVNALIAAKKKEAGEADMQVAIAEYELRNAIKFRHADPVAGLCADYVRLNGEKKAIDDHKTAIRGQLDTYSRSVMRPYEQLINDHLDDFHAGFRITQTRHGYPGGTAASSYQIVINNTAIDVGGGRAPHDRPSFKNTLSSGDRTTLALAFFLAHLEMDRALAEKTVVFDDPFNSQDNFRRLQTVHKVAKVARGCA